MLSILNKEPEISSGSRKHSVFPESQNDRGGIVEMVFTDNKPNREFSCSTALRGGIQHLITFRNWMFIATWDGAFPYLNTDNFLEALLKLEPKPGTVL